MYFGSLVSQLQPGPPDWPVCRPPVATSSKGLLGDLGQPVQFLPSS